MKQCKLKAAMAEKGYSGNKLATEIGMNVETFYRKMRSGNFTVKEAYQISTALEIQNILDIFFDSEVT